MYKLTYILMIIGLCGCSAHSPFIISNTTDINKKEGTSTYPEHNRTVYITKESLPKTVEYKLLADIEVGKVWYGSSQLVLNSLATTARKIGADAVIDVKTWHQASGWSWSAPHGSGKAVKIIKLNGFDLNTLDGEKL